MERMVQEETAHEESSHTSSCGACCRMTWQWRPGAQLHTGVGSALLSRVVQLPARWLEVVSTVVVVFGHVGWDGSI